MQWKFFTEYGLGSMAKGLGNGMELTFTECLTCARYFVIYLSFVTILQLRGLEFRGFKYLSVVFQGASGRAGIQIQVHVPMTHSDSVTYHLSFFPVNVKDMWNRL